MNQAVSSDPLSSRQIRTKGKTLKGLMGDTAPYFGDHVELSDDASDFASSLGIGAIVGTKFTWPNDRHPHSDYLLTPEKESSFRKWVDIYKQKMLSKGVYRGELYDIGFDKPETHAIQTEEIMNFAFYAESWSGKIELRGLEKRKYRIHDYENDQSIGTVVGPVATVDVAFKKHLLIEAIPLD
jgi:alpha-galactosidase